MFFILMVWCLVCVWFIRFWYGMNGVMFFGCRFGCGLMVGWVIWNRFGFEVNIVILGVKLVIVLCCVCYLIFCLCGWWESCLKMDCCCFMGGGIGFWWMWMFWWIIIGLVGVNWCWYVVIEKLVVIYWKDCMKLLCWNLWCFRWCFLVWFWVLYLRYDICCVLV